MGNSMCLCDLRKGGGGQEGGSEGGGMGGLDGRVAVI